jgi:hypothetical protein
VKVKWACPKCGADAGKHGAGGQDKCRDSASPVGFCAGFLCECDTEESEEDAHGSFENPCFCAACYHCGWAGTFPTKPKGLQAWEKKALEAGWSPPASRKKELGL